MNGILVKPVVIVALIGISHSTAGRYRHPDDHPAYAPSSRSGHPYHDRHYYPHHDGYRSPSSRSGLRRSESNDLKFI